MVIKSKKKPAPPKKWIKVEYIKGVPNTLTSKYLLKELRRERAEAGIDKDLPHICYFCGKGFERIQAFRQHLRWCRDRAAYTDAMENGFKFNIAGRSYSVKTNRWSWLAAAAELETGTNAGLAAGKQSARRRDL
jgi:hypothetical protein